MKIARFAVPALAVAALTLAASPNAYARKRPQLDDAAKAVKRALRNDYYLSKFKLDTDTVANHIEIEGNVSRYSLRTRAFKIARRVAPRYIIKNRVDVKY